MFDRASKKLGLDRAILNSSSLRESGNGAAEVANAQQKSGPSGREVDALLRNGAYGLFNDDDDESRSFCEADIDKILEARTQLVVHDQAGNSSFAKASFAPASARPELDVNDPDFWTKLLPERNNRPDPKILNVPRQRKAIQRFSLEDVEDSDLELSDDMQGEEGGDLYEEEEVMGDDEYEPPPDAGKENPKVVFVGWSQVARNRIQKGILLFGYGRWRKIRNVEKIRRPELMMELYGRAYLRKLCACLTMEMDEALQQLDNTDEDELDEEKDAKVAAAIKAKQESESAASTTNTTTTTTTTATTTTETTAAEGMEVEEPVKQEQAASLPAVEAAPEVKGEEMIVEKTEEPEVDYVKLYDAVYDEDRALNEPAFLAKLKATAKTIYKRLKLLAMLGDLVRSEFRGFSENNWPVAAGSGPGSSEYPEWWTPKHDKDLLIGTYRHGFGRYERIRCDPELSFNGNVRVSEAMKMKKKPGRKGPGRPKAEPEPPVPVPEEEINSDLPQWPSAKYLTHRVKYALDQLTATFGPSTGMKSVSFPKRTPSGKERTQKLRTDWSKREMTDFYRVISSYGIPFKRQGTTGTPGKAKAEETDENEKDYVFIKEQAKLTQKTLEMIKQYAEDYITQCQELLEDPNADKNTKSKTSSLTYVQAKRALERVILFDELRKHVIPQSDKVLGEKFEVLKDPFIISQSGLPSWWVPVVHDCALVRGVTQYGFCKWELILGDARLPFKAAIEAHTEKEEREKAEAEKRAKEKAEAEAQAKAQRQQMFAQYQQTTLNPAAAGFGLTPFPGQPQQMVYFPIPTAEQPPAQVTQPVVEQPKPVEKKEKQQHHDDDDEDAEMGDDDEDGDEFKDTKKSSKKSKKGKRGGKKSAILSSVPRDKIFFKRLNVLVNVAKAEKPLSKLEILNFDDNILLFLGNLKRPEGDSATPGKSKRGGKKLDVKYDEQGKPIYPINVCGVLSILNLGTIEDSSGFQKDKHILPVGYKSRREYISYIDPSKRTHYICEILKENEQPLFRITPEEDPSNPVEARNATAAWGKITDKIQAATQKSKKGSVAGPDYFGYSMDGVVVLISKLPGADKYNKQKERNFVLPKGYPTSHYPAQFSPVPGAGTPTSPLNQRSFGFPYQHPYASSYFPIGLGGIPAMGQMGGGMPGAIPGTVSPNTGPGAGQIPGMTSIPGANPGMQSNLFYPPGMASYQWQVQMLRQQQAMQQPQSQVPQPTTQPPPPSQAPQQQPTQTQGPSGNNTGA